MEPGFEGWALLELMGHRKRAGYVREVELAGTKVLRIDMPCGKDEAEQDRVIVEYYSASALFALRPSDEATIRGELAILIGMPFDAWEPLQLLPDRPY